MSAPRTHNQSVHMVPTANFLAFPCVTRKSPPFPWRGRSTTAFGENMTGAAGTFFDAFIARVLSQNPAGLIAGAGKTNTYNAADGRKVEFDPIEQLVHSNETGIKAVNGKSQPTWVAWAGAEGSFNDEFGTGLINKTAAPVVTIKNPRFPGQTVTLDFGDKGAPKYAAP